MQPQSPFLSGPRLVLTALSESDVLESNWFNWFNDEKTTRFLQHHYFPNTREQQLEYFRNEIANNSSRLQLGISLKEKGPIFGVIALQNIDLLNRKAEFSVVIGEPEFHRKGYSLEAMALILKHGFETLNLHRIYGGTLISQWSDRLCEVFGFQNEGVLREDVFKNGQYCDVYRIGLLKKDFKQPILPLSPDS